MCIIMEACTLCTVHAHYAHSHTEFLKKYFDFLPSVSVTVQQCRTVVLRHFHVSVPHIDMYLVTDAHLTRFCAREKFFSVSSLVSRLSTNVLEMADTLQAVSLYCRWALFK